jgi:hypothetical protein
MLDLRRLILFVLLGFGLVVVPLAAQGTRGPSTGPEFKPNYPSARREIQDFEGVLNDVISIAFNSAPFAISQKPKGVYLQGYGMTFSFIVNIHRAMIRTPFGDKNTAGITPEQKRRRIDELKEALIRTLLLRGDGLRQLGREEAISIVGFIEDWNFPDEESQNKTVILSALRRDVEELARRDDRIQDFRQRIKIVEY